MITREVESETDCTTAEEHRLYVQQLFRRHYREMYRLAVLLLHDEAESKDVVHDIFALLLGMPERQLRQEKAEAYLLTSVRNRCLNVLRGRKIQERVKRLYRLELDTDVLPDEQLYEELKMLSRGIALLVPPVCREVIELHFGQGLTFREIALRFGVSETTVYKYLRNALKQLRTHLKRD